MSFKQLITEDMRLTILRVLAEDADYSHNEHVLQAALGSLGHNVGLDRVRMELSWLDDQGMIVTDDGAGVVVAKLTSRGQDVALGRTVVPGIKRPAPGI